MHRVLDDPSASPTLPPTFQPGTPGYFTSGNPTTGLQATIVTQDWANAVQEELGYVIEQAGITLSKTDRTQLYQALQRYFRLRLTAATTYYVSPTGSDSADGLTPSTAWQSITHAYNYIRDRVDTNGYQTTIKLAPGTYSGGYVQFPVIGPAPILLGNDLDPSTCIVNNPTGPAIVVAGGANLVCQSFTVTAGGPAGDYGSVGTGLLAAGGVIQVTNMHFGVCSYAHMQTISGGVITFGRTGQAYSIVGGAAYHVLSAGGYCSLVDAAVTLTGTPAFGQAYAWATDAGQLYLWATTFTGSATGKRYQADTQGLIRTNAGGANYLPGSVAGTVDAATYGLYI